METPCPDSNNRICRERGPVQDPVTILRASVRSYEAVAEK